MKILVLDNYDSFTYNLVYMLRELGLEKELEVRRNDRITVDEASIFDAIMFSPGPGIPSEAGFMPELIRRYAYEKPMLGVCLGHQAIAEAFGARLRNLDSVFHGLSSEIQILDDSDPVFAGLPTQFEAGRYHSWIVDRQDFPADLEVLARDANGTIMALRHQKLPLYGLQFHPESILSQFGTELLSNWVELARQSIYQTEKQTLR